VAAVGFEVMSVTFNPSNENYLAVCGPRECRVLTLNSRDEVVDQLSVELALDGANTVLRAAWLPASQVRLGIIASQCVKVYDLSRDALSPLYYFTLLEDSVREAVFAHRSGATTMLLLSATGMLFAQPLGSLQDGPCIITDTISVPPNLSGTSGSSLYYSHELDLLFATYSDGKCVALRLNPAFTEVVGGFIVTPSSPPPSKTATAPTVAPLAPHSSWVELESVPGNLVALSYASPVARAQAPLVGVSITKDEVKLQALKPAPLSSSTKSIPRVEGITVIGGKKQSVLVLMDDGSIHRYDSVVVVEPEPKREEAVAASPAKPAVPRPK
jgi:E3 ubiquitin-protein ligase UBR4